MSEEDRHIDVANGQEKINKSTEKIFSKMLWNASAKQWTRPLNCLWTASIVHNTDIIWIF